MFEHQWFQILQNENTRNFLGHIIYLLHEMAKYFKFEQLWCLQDNKKQRITLLK